MVKTYSWEEIQIVYKQFHESPHSVVYSIDGGLTWASPEMDTGKWGSGLEPDIYWNMKFAFLEHENYSKEILFACWLNQNYCTWNPDDNTWIHRVSDYCFTTEELFEKFKEECQEKL